MGMRWRGIPIPDLTDDEVRGAWAQAERYYDSVFNPPERIVYVPQHPEYQKLAFDSVIALDDEMQKRGIVCWL